MVLCSFSHLTPVTNVPVPALRSKCRNPATLHDDLLINPLFNIAIFDSFVRCYASLVHIYIEEAYAAMVSSVSTISTKACAACIAHPKRRVVGFVLRERAVFICVVTGIGQRGSLVQGNAEYLLSAADHQNIFLNQSIPESRIESWRSYTFSPLSFPRKCLVLIFRKRDMDESQIHMYM